MSWVPDEPKYKAPEAELKYVCTAWTWWGNDVVHAEFDADTEERAMQEWEMEHLNDLWHVSIKKVKR